MHLGLTRQRGADIALAAAVIAIAELQFGLGHLPGPTWLGVLNGPSFGGVILARRRFPWAAVFTTFMWAEVSGLLGLSQLDDIGEIITGLMVLFALAVRAPPKPAFAGFLFAVALVALSALKYGFFDYLWSWVILGGAFAAGVAFRRRRILIEALRDALAELAENRLVKEHAAVATERIRIARELHDVVAHAVSVMVVQATGAEEMLSLDPRRAQRPLRSVQDTGRLALDELRRLLAMLRPEAEHATALIPQPGLADVDAMINGMREIGLDVRTERTGAGHCYGPGMELAAYRIIQEALTNVVRHAHAQTVVVVIQSRPESLAIEISDDGQAGSPAATGGHGQVGMRERAALYGGELLAGPRPEGGYRVWARLPVIADQ